MGMHVSPQTWNRWRSCIVPSCIAWVGVFLLVFAVMSGSRSGGDVSFGLGGPLFTFVMLLVAPFLPGFWYMALRGDLLGVSMILCSPWIFIPVLMVFVHFFKRFRKTTS